MKVGTSGYVYFWNEGKPTPFEWYLRRGFNTVEINASFYRFPTASWVGAWRRAPEGFDFSVKVHRSITHYAKLRGKAFELWRRFGEPLREMRGRISFWLFQMPPSFLPTERSIEAVHRFFRELNLGSAAVLEFRDPAWWGCVDVCRELGAGFCSVDAPGLPRDMVAVNDVLYLRLHGRKEWYAHVYSEEELQEIIRGMKEVEASKKYVYLNNDHGMLENGGYLLRYVDAV